MNNNPEQLYAFLQSIGGIAWEADTGMQQFAFAGDQGKQFLGFAPQTWADDPGFWEAHIHPDDKGVVYSYLHLNDLPEKNHSFEYRMLGADGNIVWVKDNVSLVSGNGALPVLRGIMVETTTARRLGALEHLEKNVLRMNSAINISLRELLLSYLSGLEELFPRMQCSIIRVRNRRLYDGVSPSLPAAYMAAIDNLQIGENEGSCGAAAVTKKQVIVSDISTDPKWAAYRKLALDCQLRACWSNPVIDADGEVIAILAMYYNEPKSPGEEELQVMERATSLLRVILENRQKTEIISEANLLMLQSQELAHFGNWRWDVVYNIVTWSPALYTIYGLNPDDFKATFEGYQELLHPDDRLGVYQIIENVLKTGEDAEFEERIIRPSGEIRHLRSWAKLKYNQNGLPTEMIGACLDITEKVNYVTAIQQQNQQLVDIAWMQSHLIRSPLTRMMGLIELIKNSSAEEIAKNELMDYLLASAHELDEQIRTISQKTESFKQ